MQSFTSCQHEVKKKKILTVRKLETPPLLQTRSKGSLGTSKGSPCQRVHHKIWPSRLVYNESIYLNCAYHTVVVSFCQLGTSAHLCQGILDLKMLRNHWCQLLLGGYFTFSSICVSRPLNHCPYLWFVSLIQTESKTKWYFSPIIVPG